jgi:lipid A 4'-phosphatase
MAAEASRTLLQEQHTKSNASLLIWGAIGVGVVAGLLFCAFPEIDLKTSEFFYQGGGVFSGKRGGIFTGPPQTASDYIRLALYLAFIGICVLNALGLALSLIRKREALGLTSRKWLFLAACLAIGPGLVANVVLKDHWGRARPVHITEFGGSKTYSLPLVPSDQCRSNCSFVAGEPSMMYTVFFAAAFLFPAFYGSLIASGIAVGLFSGLIRISQGAHFLSDVVFAGVTMALTVACIYLVFKAVAPIDINGRRPSHGQRQ